MDDCAVTDADVFADVVVRASVAVDDDVFLAVGALADGDGGDITADDGPVPEVNPLTEGDLAHDTGGVGEVDVLDFSHIHRAVW